MAIMEEVEKAKKKKHEAETHYRNSMPASSYQQQKLRVCEVNKSYFSFEFYMYSFGLNLLNSHH